MAVDFGKLFGLALRYPLKRDVYFLLLVFSLITGILSWFVTGYFMGDITGAEASVADFMGKLIVSMVYLAPVTIISWLIGILLMSLYFHNSMWFYNGKRKPIIESFDITKKRFLPLLLTIIVIMLILVACFGGAFLLIVFSLITQQILMLIAGAIWLMIGAIIGVFVSFMIILAPVFCVLEKTGPMESVKKSWNIIMKNKLNTFLFLIIYFVIFIIIWLVGSIPETVYTLLAGQSPMLSLESLSFFVFRMFFSVYLTLFAHSSFVNYYLSIKKKFAIS
jgi:hypothetical protein